MPALLDKLQKQQQQQQRRQQQTQQNEKLQELLLKKQIQKQQQQSHQLQQHYSQRLHYHYQHHQHRAHQYRYQHYQHDFSKQEAKRFGQQDKFYNLNTNRDVSKSSNIIITTITTTTTSPTSSSSSASVSSSLSLSSVTQLPTPTISQPILIPTPKPISIPTTSTYTTISTRRLCAAIFTLMLSIISHYSNAQQTFHTATMILQVPRNFQQLPEGQTQLNISNTWSKSNNNDSIANNIDRTFSNYSNTVHNINFSATLEDQLETVDNNTKQFESLSIVDLERNKNEHLQSIDSQPIFDFGMPRNITGRTGHSEAVIKCRVDMLNDKSVSWIRKRDLHILTVGTTTYTTDKRFEVSSSKDEREWTLHIKAPQARDSGIYECQINTEPKISMAFQLNVIEIPADAKAIITGPPDLHFKVGSAIVLQCLVAQPTVKDIGPIYWYRGEQMITPFQQDDKSDYDMGAADSAFLSPFSTANVADAKAKAIAAATANVVDNANSYVENARTMHDLTNDITLDFTARIAMESQLGDTLKSRLRISNAQTTDTGNYTCQPTTASSASVMVHVINDENPAAMQKSCAVPLTAPAAAVSKTFFLCCLILLSARRHTYTLKFEKRMLDHVMVSLVSFSLMAMVMVIPLLKLLLIWMFVAMLVLLSWMVLIAIAIPFLIVGNVAAFDGGVAAVVITVVTSIVVVAPTLSPALLEPLLSVFPLPLPLSLSS